MTNKLFLRARLSSRSNKLACFFILFVLSVLFTKAQGFRTWHYTAQASNNRTREIFEISPGVYMGTGFAVDTSTGVPRNSLTLMGLNAQGQVQWLKKHSGGSLEYINNPFAPHCFYKKNNTIYFIGCAHDSDGGNGRMFGVFIKYNLSGDTIWRKTYRSSDSLEDVVPQMVTASTDGGFLITGFFQHWGNN
jgi:hypothetical protein